MIKEQWKAARNAHFWQVVEPWEDQTIEQANSNSPTVAYAWGSTEELAEARARLIAAAPDLLSALEAVKSWDVSNLALDIPLEIRKQMQAAIEKATGEQK